MADVLSLFQPGETDFDLIQPREEGKTWHVLIKGTGKRTKALERGQRHWKEDGSTLQVSNCSLKTHQCGLCRSAGRVRCIIASSRVEVD